MATGKFQILLVEDNTSDVDLIKESIRINSLNCELVIAKDGAEALRFFENVNKDPEPHIIVLDLNLPKIDGFAVMQRLKEDSRFRHIPIIVFTSSQADDDIWKSYDLHANCYITKPFVLDQFIGAVKSIVDFWSLTAKVPVRE